MRRSAHQEYGRAAERFSQAADLNPTVAVPRFLLGQAHLALGNYGRAFDAILMGLRAQPDWPRTGFRPLELYGENVADHTEHVRILEEVLATAPDDPQLLFLTGYLLWLDGRHEEAAAHLERAAPGLPDPAIVDRILNALPASDVF